MGNGNAFRAVSDGLPTVTSLVTTDGNKCVGGVCMVRMVVLAKFFNEDFSFINVIGSVELKMVGDSNTRRLAESIDNESSTGFDMLIKLGDLNEVAGAVMNSLVFSTILLTAIMVAFIP